MASQDVEGQLLAAAGETGPATRLVLNQARIA